MNKYIIGDDKCQAQNENLNENEKLELDFWRCTNNARRRPESKSVERRVLQYITTHHDTGPGPCTLYLKTAGPIWRRKKT